MANTLGDLSLSDMKWLGTPADPIGSYQKGVNLAEQKQRMGQSADMHPLKMQAAEGDIAYRGQQTSLLKQQGVYNDRTMDSRVGLAASADSLQNTAAWLAAETKTYKKSLSETAASMQEINAADAEINRDVNTRAKAAFAERTITNQEINANTRLAQENNFRYTTAINKTKSEWLPHQLHNEYQANQQIIEQTGMKIERQTAAFDQWNKAKPFLQVQMRVVDSLSPADLENYEIPFTLFESPEAMATIKAHILNRKSTKIHGDHVDAVTAVDAELKTVRTEQTNMVKELVRGGGHKLLDAHRHEDGTLKHSGEMLLPRLTKSKEAMDKLKAAGIPEAVIKKAIITTPKLPPAGPIGPGGQRGFIGPGAGILPPGAQYTSNYGDLYDGMPVLDDDGFDLVDRLIKEKGATRTTAQITQAGDYGQIITGATLKDGKMEYTFARGMPTPSELGKQVLAEVKDIAENAEVFGMTDKDGVVDMPAVYREALKRAGMANTPFARNADDAKGLNLGPGDRYFNINNYRMEQINDNGISGPALAPAGQPQSGVLPGGADQYTGTVLGKGELANDAVLIHREEIFGLLTTEYNAPIKLARKIIDRFHKGVDYDPDEPISKFIKEGDAQLYKKGREVSRGVLAVVQEKALHPAEKQVSANLEFNMVMPQIVKQIAPFIDQPGWKGPKTVTVIVPEESKRGGRGAKYRRWTPGPRVITLPTDKPASLRILKDGVREFQELFQFRLELDSLGKKKAEAEKTERERPILEQRESQRMKREAEIKAKKAARAAAPEKNQLKLVLERLRFQLQRQLDQGQGASARKTRAEIIEKSKRLKELEALGKE